MKSILIALLLSAAALTAKADELIVHGLSVHPSSYYVEDGVKKNYNNTNAGLGWRWADGWAIGFYYNSYNITSVYVGKSWMWPLDVSVAGRPVEAGVGVIAATGYSDRSGLALTPLPLVIISVPVTQRVSAVVSAAPVYRREVDDSKSLGVLGNLSLSYSF